MKRKHIVLFLAAIVFVVGLWLFTPYLVVVIIGRTILPGEAGPFGDIYGSVNALYTGLALLGVAYTLLVQSNRNALDDAERSKESKRAALIAQLTALPILIRQEKERIWAIDGAWIADFPSKDYTPARLGVLKGEVIDRIKFLEPTIAKMAQRLEEKPTPAESLYGVLEDIAENHNRMMDELERKKELIPRLERLTKLTVQLEEVSNSLVSSL